MKNNIIIFIKSILAGICIAIGCNIYLACENKYIGAILFSIGLITILLLDFNLYTGKIGYVLQKDIVNIKQIVIILFGNVIGCVCIGLMFQSDIAQTICENKLQSSLLSVLPKSIMCGLLMFIAVDSYKRYKTILPTVFCIPTFILSGYEHSIADIAYFTMGRVITLKVLCFIIIAIMGNAIGGLLIPICNKWIENLNKTK